MKSVYMEAPEEEKDGIKQLQDEKLRHLRYLKRAESLRKGRKRTKKNVGEF